MILFTILVIIAIILTVITIAVVSVAGAAGIIVFGDVIVCLAIIIFIIVKIIKRKRD